MEVLYERVAGLDIGKASVTVCVRTPGTRRGSRHSQTRTFKTTTGSLAVMWDWLVEVGVTIAAMESTSTYWKPPFYCLEEAMTVWLLNAAHMVTQRRPSFRRRVTPFAVLLDVVDVPHLFTKYSVKSRLSWAC